MDPYTHTLIAVGLMFGSYWAGRHLGYKDGLIDVWSALLTVFDAKSIVIKAEGEAQSAKLISDAIKENPGFVQLRKIDAAEEIANTMSRSQNRMFLNADALLMNIIGQEGAAIVAGSMKK